MELVVLELAPGLDVAGFLVHHHHAVFHDPLGRFAIPGIDPFIKILAIEKDGGPFWSRGFLVGSGLNKRGNRFPCLRVLGLGLCVFFLSEQIGGHSEKDQTNQFPTGFHDDNPQVSKKWVSCFRRGSDTNQPTGIMKGFLGEMP